MNRDLFTVKVCDLVAIVLLGLILAPWESVGLGWLPVVGPHPAPGENYVLIVEETHDRDDLNTEWLDSTILLGYLKRNFKSYRIIDKDSDLDDAPKQWREMREDAKEPWPSVVIRGPSGNYSGPLPGGLKDTMTFLKQYGGE